ncbi:MAG: lipopolysaccharide biosynthesis protein [Pseudomonadota bacterium]
MANPASHNADAMVNEPSEDLTRRVAVGALVVGASRLTVRSLGLINTLILARLLTPEDFGLVALGVTIMQLLQNISDIGVSETVVRYRNAERKQLDTLFTVSLIRGVLIAAFFIAAAPFAAGIFDDPRIYWVFIGVSVTPLFHALMNPRFFEFERSLDFSRDFLAAALNKLVAVAVSIAIALTYQTYWAIIAGLAAGTLIQTIISYVVKPYLPRLSLAAFRELVGFTGWLTGVSLAAALNNKLDVLFLGRLVGPAATGAYFVGGQIASLPTEELAAPMSKAVYPGLAALQKNRDRMRNAFLRSVEVQGAITMPAAIGAAFVAPDLIALLLGGQWRAAVPVLQGLAPGVAISSVFYATQPYAVASGHTRAVFIKEILLFFIRMPLFLFAAIQFALIGAVVAAAFAHWVHAVLNLLLYARVSGEAFWRPLKKLWRPIAGCAAMALFFLLIRPAAPMFDDAPLLLRLTADIAAGVGIYGVTVVALWRMSGAPSGPEQMAVNALQNGRRRLDRNAAKVVHRFCARNPLE